MRETLREAVDLVRPLARGREIAVRADVPDGDVHVLADRQRLQQVLLNLLSNAVKYNRAGGTVIVACAQGPGDRFQIRVTDTGPGMAPDQVERLFTPFERLGAEATGTEGTGAQAYLTKPLDVHKLLALLDEEAPG